MEIMNQKLIRYDEAIIILLKYCLLIHISSFLVSFSIDKQFFIVDVSHVTTDVFIFIYTSFYYLIHLIAQLL